MQFLFGNCGVIELLQDLMQLDLMLEWFESDQAFVVDFIQ